MLLFHRNRLRQDLQAQDLSTSPLRPRSCPHRLRERPKGFINKRGGKPAGSETILPRGESTWSERTMAGHRREPG